jgi:HTH-type transcriptional regulator, sugar sensing transcriptional regulator
LILERVIKALVYLGLPRVDAEVYIYIAKNGPLKSREIAQKLKLKKKQLEYSLRNLQDKDIVRTKSKVVAEFVAVPFEEALNLLIEINKEQTELLNKIRKELLSNWKKPTKKISENN